MPNTRSTRRATWSARIAMDADSTVADRRSHASAIGSIAVTPARGVVGESLRTVSPAEPRSSKHVGGVRRAAWLTGLSSVPPRPQGIGCTELAYLPNSGCYRRA